MREIGSIENEAHARLFGDFLFSRGVDNELRQERSGAWAVWIRSEDQVAPAKDLLDTFHANPDAPEYRLVAGEAERVKKARAEQDEEVRKRIIARRQIFSMRTKIALAPLTMLLIAISCLVSLALIAGGPSVDSFFSISNFEPEGGPFWEGLVEIREGQVWRLITPIFLHFGILHLLFNMYWLHTLGGALEQEGGWRRFLLLVVPLAVFSNLAQYVFEGPHFGGMSGVVYGLFGYIWMRCKYDPSCKLPMNRSTILVMVIWYFVCWTGFLGPIANMAHTGGLALGMLWGWITATRGKS
jgi:GlpG protein